MPRLLRLKRREGAMTVFEVACSHSSQPNSAFSSKPTGCHLGQVRIDAELLLLCKQVVAASMVFVLDSNGLRKFGRYASGWVQPSQVHGHSFVSFSLFVALALLLRFAEATEPHGIAISPCTRPWKRADTMRSRHRQPSKLRAAVS